MSTSSQDFKAIRRGWLTDLEPKLRSGSSGQQLSAELCERWDRFLDRHCRDRLGDDHERVALFALGSYGRHEMAPFSDVDIMVVVPESPEKTLLNGVEGLIRSLWELGLNLGHSVRTRPQAAQLAGEDIFIATSLLDARFITGSPDLLPDPRAWIGEIIREVYGDRFVELVYQGVQHRHHEFGDSAYLLEPQSKLGRGGLRDLSAFDWSAEVRYSTRESERLARRGQVGQTEMRRLEEARGFILRTRFALHLYHGWKQDQLTFQAQGPVAALMGYGEAQPLDAQSRFMRDYYLHAREVATCVELWFEEWALDRLEPREIAARFVCVSDTDREAIRHEPRGVFDLLARAQSDELRLHPQARRTLASAAFALPAAVALESEPNRLVRAIIGDIDDAGRLLWNIAEAGLLSRVLPEWRHLAGYAQPDVYHVYTADVHLLTTCQRAKEILRGDADVQSPYLSRVAARYHGRHDCDSLLLACLLHDVGKGLAANHSIIGAGMAAEVAQRMGFSPEEQAFVRTLVREHLLMPKVSQRRDIGDPSTLRAFCAKVRSQRLLDALTLLSFADMDSVGPHHLNAWKLNLLVELHQAADDHLAGEAIERRDGTPSRERRALVRAILERDLERADLDRLLDSLPVRFLDSCEPPQLVRCVRLMAATTDGSPAVAFHDDEDRSFTEVLICDSRRRGHLADVAGMLDVAGLDIRKARSFALEVGGTVSVFEVCTTDTAHRAIPARRRQRIADQIVHVLSGQTSFDQILNAKLSQSRLPPRSRPEVQLSVALDNQFDPTFTIVEVKALDRPGLLAHIARALTDLDLRVDRSIITTEGNRAIDTFYVADAMGQKLEAARLPEVRQRLLDDLRQRLDG